MKILYNLISIFILVPILLYRWFISPILPASCRYRPTCSAYAIDAIKLYGPLQGTVLAVKRIASCHPWGGYGYNPVSKNLTCNRGNKRKSVNKKTF